MASVYVSLGSNIDRESHIPGAIADLAKAFGPLHISSIYETEAVGFDGTPFYNLVVGFVSSLLPTEIAAVLGQIERRHGRTPESKKFAARTLDIDMLLYGEEPVEIGKLKLPRQEITQYAFMLEPLAEIAGQIKHPSLPQTIAELWDQFDKRAARQHRVGLFD